MKARRKTREREGRRKKKKRRFSQHVSHWRLSVHKRFHKERKRERERVARACALALPSIAPSLSPSIFLRCVNVICPLKHLPLSVHGSLKGSSSAFHHLLSVERAATIGFLYLGSEEIVKTDRQPCNQPAFHWMEYRQPPRVTPSHSFPPSLSSLFIEINGLIRRIGGGKERLECLCYYHYYYY